MRPRQRITLDDVREGRARIRSADGELVAEWVAKGQLGMPFGEFERRHKARKGEKA